MIKKYKVSPEEMHYQIASRERRIVVPDIFDDGEIYCVTIHDHTGYQMKFSVTEIEDILSYIKKVKNLVKK